MEKAIPFPGWLFFVVRPAGLEPAAYCSASSRSNPLSYERLTKSSLPRRRNNVNLYFYRLICQRRSIHDTVRLCLRFIHYFLVKRELLFV